MRIGYFSAAWQDVKNTPGWVGKLLIMSLLMLIPVFGWVVVAGCLLGWARDLAWGVHAPMPSSILGNEDGKLYSRGFFALIISIVCSVIPLVAFVVFDMAFAVVIGGLTSFHIGGHWLAPMGMVSAAGALAVFAAAIALGALATAFLWVGWMRMSIYGRLSAGFQLGRIWSMIRHDATGLARIFGMSLLIYAILAAAMWIAVTVVVVGTVVIGMMAIWFGLSLESPSLAIWVLVVTTVFALAISFSGVVAFTFCEVLVIRALGYWTRQFDVPHWRGQDDPMPFEVAAGGVSPE